MKLYIFGGNGEKINSYNWLIKAASKKYDVNFMDFQLGKDSLKDLRRFKIEKNSVVFGFSEGALAAYKLPVKVKFGIYCSISNILEDDSVGNEEILIKEFGREILDDLRTTKYGTPKAEDFIIMCGENEITPRDKIFESKLGLRVVKNAGHFLNAQYKAEILKGLGLKAVN